MWNQFPICFALQSASSLAVMIHRHYMQISSFKEEEITQYATFNYLVIISNFWMWLCENPLKEPGVCAYPFNTFFASLNSSLAAMVLR